MNDQNFNQENYTPPVVEPINPFPPKPTIDFHAIFSSGLFLALCILMTVVTATSAISIDLESGHMNYNLGVDVISLLVTIGMWMAFAAAKKTDIPFPSNGLRIASGTVYAMRVIAWVVAVIFLVCAIICVVCGTLLPAEILQNSAEFNITFDAELRDALSTFMDDDMIDVYLHGADWATILPLVFIACGIFIAIVAIVVMILNVTFYKRLHLFVQSVYRNVDNPAAKIRYANGTYIWLLVMGILSIFSGLGGIVMIVGAVFVKKYFADPIQD